MDMLTLLLLATLPVLTIVAGLTDITTMKIPNWISGVLILGFFPAAFAAGLSPMSVAAHVGIGFAALLAGMAMFAMRWLGGGDAKLLAVACMWMGVSGSLTFVLFTALAGGAFSLFLLSARTYIGPHVVVGPNWMLKLMKPEGDIPYGVAIAVGALMAFPHSEMVSTFAAGF